MDETWEYGESHRRPGLGQGEVPTELAVLLFGVLLYLENALRADPPTDAPSDMDNSGLDRALNGGGLPAAPIPMFCG